MIDVQESVRVRRLVRSKPKQCYVNAARVILGVPEYKNADYVEGLVAANRYVGMEDLARRYENYDPEFATENLAV